MRQRRPALVILDVWLQGSEMDGLQLLEEIRREDPPIPVVMISGHGTIDTAVSAIKNGAYDFIEKPFKADRLLLVVDRAVEADRLRRENATLRRRAGGEVGFVGSSGDAAGVRTQIERVAPMGSRVLITGASGAGKETVARLIHMGSKRADGPFVVVNCSTLPAERLEIELFGTDTASDGDSLRVSGAFELAHGGTLLLKEVADLPLPLQSKLARLLQEQSYARDGGKTRVEVDVRVLASTTHALQEEIAASSLPRRALPSPECRVVAHPAAQRAPRGHPRARDRAAAPRRRCHRAPDPADGRGYAGGPAGPRLAGQRAAVAQCDRAAADPGAGGRRPDPGRRAAQRRQRGCAVGAALGEGRRDHAAARCATRARCSSANICWPRSRASAATSRAPRPSSAWSARRCIAS